MTFYTTTPFVVIVAMECFESTKMAADAYSLHKNDVILYPIYFYSKVEKYSLVEVVLTIELWVPGVTHVWESTLTHTTAQTARVPHLTLNLQDELVQNRLTTVAAQRGRWRWSIRGVRLGLNQSGSDWPQMERIRDYFKSDFSKFWLKYVYKWLVFPTGNT